LLFGEEVIETQRSWLIVVIWDRYNNASEEERIEKGKNGHSFAGVGGSKESVEWLWSISTHSLLFPSPYSDL
jgi:hypothetical protein